MISPAYHEGLVSTKALRRAFGVSSPTIHKWATDGMPCVVLPSGHKRYDLRECQIWKESQGDYNKKNLDNVGDSNPLQPSFIKPKILLIVRTSTPKQNKARGSSDKSDQERQKERLLSYVSDRWGDADITIRERNTSGVNFNDVTLKKIIGEIIDKKYNYVLATTFDRILRLAIGLFEIICTHTQTQIIYTDPDTDEVDIDDISQCVDELMAYICSISSRIYGNRTRKALKIYLDEDTLKFSYLKTREGWTLEQIQDDLRRRNVRTDKGKHYVYGVIHRQLKERWKECEEKWGGIEVETSFDRFWQENIIKGNIDGGIKPPKLYIHSLLNSYRTWCTKTNSVCLSGNKVGRILNDMGLIRKTNDRGNRYLLGFSLAHPMPKK